MARMFIQYFVIYNNENSPNDINFAQIMRNTKLMLSK